MTRHSIVVPAGGYHPGMPSSRHPRVQVRRDPQLDRAIARGRALLGADVPAAQVVHDLALRGLEAMEEDAVERSDGRDFLISVADGESGLDLDGLRDVRDRAWR
jgi:hypothetical protein